MAPKEKNAKGKKASPDVKKIINFYKLGLSMEKQITVMTSRRCKSARLCVTNQFICRCFHEGMSMWSDKVSLNHLWSCIYILKSIDDPECQKAADQGIGNFCMLEKTNCDKDEKILSMEDMAVMPYLRSIINEAGFYYTFCRYLSHNPRKLFKVYKTLLSSNLSNQKCNTYKESLFQEAFMGKFGIYGVFLTYLKEILIHCLLTLSFEDKVKTYRQFDLDVRRPVLGICKSLQITNLNVPRLNGDWLLYWISDRSLRFRKSNLNEGEEKVTLEQALATMFDEPEMKCYCGRPGLFYMYNYTEPKKEIVKPSEITEEHNGVKKKKKFSILNITDLNKIKNISDLMEQNENNPTSGLKAIIDDMYEELDMERPPEPESDEDENDTEQEKMVKTMLRGLTYDIASMKALKATTLIGRQLTNPRPISLPNTDPFHQAAAAGIMPGHDKDGKPEIEQFFNNPNYLKEKKKKTMASWYKIAGFKPPKDKDDTDTEDDNKDDDEDDGVDEDLEKGTEAITSAIKSAEEMKAKLEKVMNATNKYKAIRQAEKFTNKMIADNIKEKKEREAAGLEGEDPEKKEQQNMIMETWKKMITSAAEPIVDPGKKSEPTKKSKFFEKKFYCENLCYLQDLQVHDENIKKAVDICREDLGKTHGAIKERFKIACSNISSSALCLDLDLLRRNTLSTNTWPPLNTIKSLAFARDQWNVASSHKKLPLCWNWCCLKYGGVLYLCAGCRLARYCNISCARNHWGVHMEFCKMCRHNKILREPEFNEPAFIGISKHSIAEIKKKGETMSLNQMVTMFDEIEEAKKLTDDDTANPVDCLSNTLKMLMPPRMRQIVQKHPMFFQYILKTHLSEFIDGMDMEWMEDLPD